MANSVSRGCLLTSTPKSQLGGFRQTRCYFHKIDGNIRRGELQTVGVQKYSKVHKKYVQRSREELDQIYLQECLTIAGLDADSEQREMTLWSVLMFVPMWIRFYVIPHPVRYAMFLLWSSAKPLIHSIRRSAVLAGARADALLSRRSGVPRFSLAEVLRRYHGKVSVWRRLYYRGSLLAGKSATDLERSLVILDPSTGRAVRRA
mmetsp:Transcript_23784/g.56693  ORF Transcript_23784/g.56693 Transcript_23784/m.56693 type:complete len:204 (-) Transcript_23784:42-653(-)